MGLFERFRLTQQEVEARLGRPLRGDPTSGERAVLNALNESRLAEVEQALNLDRTLKPEFRTLIEEQLRKGRQRWTEYVMWQVELPGRVYEAYRAEAWANRCNLTAVLSQVLERAIAVREIEATAREAVRSGDMSALKELLDRVKSEPSAVSAAGSPAAVH